MFVFSKTIASASHLHTFLGVRQEVTLQSLVLLDEAFELIDLTFPLCFLLFDLSNVAVMPSFFPSELVDIVLKPISLELYLLLFKVERAELLLLYGLKLLLLFRDMLQVVNVSSLHLL